jgi:hypothetical protein
MASRSLEKLEAAAKNAVADENKRRGRLTDLTVDGMEGSSRAPVRLATSLRRTVLHYLVSRKSTASLEIDPFEMAMSLPSGEKR